MTTVIHKTVSAVATILVVATAAALLILGGLIAAGYKPEVVRSGSMSPMLERGSLLFVKPAPASSLRTGQVITFQHPVKGGKELVTHRIVAIEQTQDGLAFATKGDANQSRDPWLVKIDAQAGRYAFDIPAVGQLSFLVHSQGGYIALFALPLLLLAGIALWRIWTAPSAEQISAAAHA